MQVVQISDLHIGGENAEERLATVVESICALNEKPDAVLMTGDLAETGSPAQYDLLRRLLPSKVPILPVMGNHDLRTGIHRTFGADGLLAKMAGGFIQYETVIGDLRILVLDSVCEGSAEPEFCDARASWLEAELSKSAQPSLIAMHHPPTPCGVDWVDATNPNWSDALGGVVERFPERIMAIVCGHIHRPLFSNWRRVPVICAPAVYHQVSLRIGEPIANLYTKEPPGFLVHRFDGLGLTSYAAVAHGFSHTFTPNTTLEVTK